MCKHTLTLLATSTAAIALAAPAFAQQVPSPPVAPIMPSSAPVPAPAEAAPAPAAATTQIPPPQQVTPPTAPVEEGMADEEDIGDDVVVTGARERGSVPGDIPPEQVLRPSDIRAYGVNSLSELLTELAPQLGSGRGTEGGMPVVLLDGRRISGFREIRSYPPEAIERIDILPPEAAQQLGYRAEQRVINFVLRRRFNAITAQVGGGGATQGDRFTTDDEGSLLRIMRERRLNLAAEYHAQTPVYEADRDILPTTPNRPFAIGGNITPGSGLTQIDPALSALAGSTVAVAGVPTGVTGRPTLGSFLGGVNPSNFGAYRTLSPTQQRFESTASYATRLFDKIDASFTAGFDWSKRSSELGLANASLLISSTNPFSPFANPVTLNRYLVEGGAREQDNATTSTEFGMALNGDFGRWRWSFNGNYTRAFSSTLTDNNFDLTPITARLVAGDPTLNPFASFDLAALGDYRRDYARSLNSTATAETLVNGPLLALPAGDMRLSLKTGFVTSDLATRTIRSGVTTLGDLGRDVGNGQARIDVPIANRGHGVLGAIGNLSANASYAYEQQSNFGWLSTYGYGVNWSPFPGKLYLLASVNRDENAPSIGQLGNPVIVTPNARVFDFVSGTSVDVTAISGGNPALLGPERRVTNLTLNAQPISSLELNINAEYTRIRIINPIETLGTPTAALEAAFPDSFQRDATGELTRVDNRPINFARSDQEQLKWGFTFSKRIGPRTPSGFRSVFGGTRDRAGGRDVGRPPGGPPEARVGTLGPEQPQTAQAQPQSAAPPPASDNPTSGDQQTERTRSGDGRRSYEGRRSGGSGGSSSGRGGFGGSSDGRLQVSLFHTWRFRDTLLIGPGIPVLDRLNGDATNPINNNGSSRKHVVDFNVGANEKGFGLRVDGRWQSGTFVRGGSARNPTDITVDPLTTIRVRGRVDFGPQMSVVRDHPWLIGTRVELAVTNVFDARQRVRDAIGSVPINFQPDLIDPIGRTVTLSLRKLFYSRPASSPFSRR